MDPHFGPAWIGFAHSFAAEGEHEQAISAYTTAARLFQGYPSSLTQNLFLVTNPFCADRGQDTSSAVVFGDAAFTVE